MAVLPSIPTSFVPHPGGASPQRFRHDFSGVYGLFAYGVLVIIFMLAVGVFFYGQVLSSTQKGRDADLQKALADIDPATVQGFVTLRNRLQVSQSLLDKHVALSEFFKALENILPSNVRLSSLHIGSDVAGVTRIETSGSAKTFNSLAVLSEALAADGRLKDAIFSKININKNGTVSFDLSAGLDPKLIAFTQLSPDPQSFQAPASPPASTTSP